MDFIRGDYNQVMEHTGRGKVGIDAGRVDLGRGPWCKRDACTTIRANAPHANASAEVARDAYR